MNNIPFSQVPLSVFTDRGLSATAKVTYGYILSRTNKEGYCWASTETIANDLGCSPRKIQKDLRELQEANYIRRFYAEGGRKIYPQVTIKGDTQPQHRKDVKVHSKLPKNSTAKTQSLPKHMHSRSSNNITSSSKEEEVIIAPIRNNNPSSDVVPFTGTTPKADAPEPQERNTTSSQPAGFTAASGMDKKILAATDNMHNMSTWIEYLKGKYNSGYRESDEYLKMIKTIS